MTSRMFLSFVTVVALAAAPLAYAQTQGPDLQTLHDALHLTPAQQAGWAAFAASTAPDQAEMARERNAAQMLPTLPAPRRVDLSIAAMRANLQSMEQRGAELKAFYATLTPAQQAKFDRMTLPSQQR
jgi:hypothetical protein